MAENTQVGPAGGNKSTPAITPHQTLAHRDDTVGGSDDSPNVTLGKTGELKPINQ